MKLGPRMCTRYGIGPPGFRCRSLNAARIFVFCVHLARRTFIARGSLARNGPSGNCATHWRRMRQHCFISCILTNTGPSNRHRALESFADADVEVELVVDAVRTVLPQSSGRPLPRIIGPESAYLTHKSFEHTPTLLVRLMKMWLNESRSLYSSIFGSK